MLKLRATPIHKYSSISYEDLHDIRLQGAASSFLSLPNLLRSFSSSAQNRVQTFDDTMVYAKLNYLY